MNDLRQPDIRLGVKDEAVMITRRSTLAKDYFYFIQDHGMRSTDRNKLFGILSSTCYYS